VRGCRPEAPEGNVRGFVLPLLLLLLLALTLLGHGILLLSRQELRASRAYLHAVRGDLAAVGGVSLGLETLPAPSDTRLAAITVPLGSEWIDGGLWRGVTLRWLGPELFLLEGKGRSLGWPGTRRRGAVGWMLDPLTRLGALEGGVELGGTLTLGPGTDQPSGWDPEACSPFGPSLASLYSLRSLSLTAPLVLPAPDSSGAAPGIPPLGLLTGSQLMDLADEAGLLTAGDASLTAGAGCPGSEQPGFMAVGGNLEIRDAGACGVFVVDGDLLIEGSGSFQGLALVAGNLRLLGGALFEGMARVTGSVTLEDSAILRISACPPARALSEASPLLKPLVLPGASRIPLF
jgi:hypothetical protein